jgi:TRAP-type transport system small permease protein
MKTVISVLEGVADALRLICGVLMTVSMTAMAASVFIQIVLREVFGTSFLPLDDLVVYGFAIIVFCGIALVFYTNSHLATPVVVDMLPPLGQKIMHGIADALSLMFLAIMLYEGSIYTLEAMTQYSPLLRIPTAFIFVSIPVGSLAAILFIVIRNLKREAEQAAPPDELIA